MIWIDGNARMLKHILLLTIRGTILLMFFAAGNAQTTFSASEIKSNGISGFPQASAKVLVDNADLRVSIANDSEYLAIQAIIWKDNDNASGQNSVGQPSGDYSALLTTNNKGSRLEPDEDRTYFLDPLPDMTGLYYSTYSGKRTFVTTLGNGRRVTFKAEASSPLKGDSKGKGKIEYIHVEGRTIRVDTFVIPISELGKHAMSNLRACYFVSSSVPILKFNSCGYTGANDYFSQDIPAKYYQHIVLTQTPNNELKRLLERL